MNSNTVLKVYEAAHRVHSARMLVNSLEWVSRYPTAIPILLCFLLLDYKIEKANNNLIFSILLPLIELKEVALHSIVKEISTIAVSMDQQLKQLPPDLLVEIIQSIARSRDYSADNRGSSRRGNRFGSDDSNNGSSNSNSNSNYSPGSPTTKQRTTSPPNRQRITLKKKG